MIFQEKNEACDSTRRDLTPESHPSRLSGMPGSVTAVYFFLGPRLAGEMTYESFCWENLCTDTCSSWLTLRKPSVPEGLTNPAGQLLRRALPFTVSGLAVLLRLLPPTWATLAHPWLVTASAHVPLELQVPR